MDSIKQSSEIIKDHFEKLHKEHGFSPKSLDWSGRRSQVIRFQVIVRALNIGHHFSMLDVGCGFADLYKYMISCGIEVDYTGIDLAKSIIDEANKRYPQLDLRPLDILDIGEIEKFDYIVGSGIHNVRSDCDPDRHLKVIRRMFEICRVAVVTNMISSRAKNITFDPHLLVVSPFEIIETLSDLTSNFVIIHNYLPHDFTLILSKISDYEENDEK